MAKSAEQEPKGPLMSVEEIAEYLGVKPRWVRREGPAHGLPLKRIGGYIRGSRPEIDRWIDQQSVY